LERKDLPDNEINDATVLSSTATRNSKLRQRKLKNQIQKTLANKFQAFAAD
jgi:hypothetical protein